MSILKVFFGFSIIFIISCKSNLTRRIIVDDEYAEGQISKDSVFNGLIKFYDTSTKALVTEANYNNGILEGKRTDYYPNGKIRAEINYNDGKVKGFNKFYDTDEELIAKQYNYYDLRVGPSIKYVDGKPSKFYFYSLENSSLFFIDYDSIYNRKITDVQEDFFFMRKYLINPNTSADTTNLQSEYFIYLINPPKYNFIYSLCLIDDKYRILKTYKTFNTSKIWDTFQVDKSESDMGKKVVMRIEVVDSTNPSYSPALLYKEIK